jgi:hypothetical protein
MKAFPAKRYWQGLLLLAVGILPAVFAYNSTGKRWLGGTTTFYIGMAGPAPSDSRWSNAFQAAMQQWNDKTSFKFVSNPGYLSPCNGYSRSQTGTDFPTGTGDAKNGVDFRPNVCGNDWGSGVLAITLSSSTSGQFGFGYLQEADIIFNDSYKWDVYNGPRKSTVDLGRVALHELGHALGLDHESTATAIMAPKISDLYLLQPDDIAGAQSLYGQQTLCTFTALPLNGVIKNSLGSPDCRIKDLFGGGTDDSYVDVYKFSLSATTHLIADMRSSQLDSVLVLTDSRLNQLDIFDDYQNSCDAHMDKVLVAGDYLLLANTYATPAKCGSNLGSYTLSITDSLLPTMGETRTTAGAVGAATLITGGASADGGLTYKSSFTAQDSITVSARLVLDPTQVGQNGKIFVLVQLSSGARYSENSSGQFAPFNGDLSQMPSYKNGPLAATEQISVAQNLRAQGTGLAGQSVVVYVGYALASTPGNIQYGSEPLRFSIAP